MKDGRTPLFIACAKGHVDAARLLLEKGATVDRADKTVRRRCQSRKAKDHSSIVALLEEHQGSDHLRSFRVGGVEGVFKATCGVNRAAFSFNQPFCEKKKKRVFQPRLELVRVLGIGRTGVTRGNQPAALRSKSDSWRG